MKKGSRVIVNGMLGTIIGKHGVNPPMFQVFLDETKKEYKFLEHDLKEIERKIMIHGFWKIKIDEKYRLFLPVEVVKKIGKKSIFLAMSKNVIVVLFDTKLENNYPFLFEVPIRKNNRITIPLCFRENLPKEVNLVGLGNRLEIWKS